jgi:hypothetical protein
MRKLIVNVPVDPCSCIDCNIDDTPGLTVNIPGTKNASRLEEATPLAIEVAAQPNDVNKPIPCETMVAKDKLLAEGSLFGNKSNSRVVLQLQDTHYFSTESQVHCLDGSNSENDHIKMHHIKKS